MALAWHRGNTADVGAEVLDNDLDLLSCARQAATSEPVLMRAFLAINLVVPLPPQ